MGSLVTVFFLEGGRPVFGPRAAELTGLFYRSLWDRNYFTDKAQAPVQAGNQHPVSLTRGLTTRLATGLKTGLKTDATGTASRH
jgi:hypothetical protein